MIMKKTYITPNVEIVKIQTEILLSLSNPITTEGLEGLDGYGGTDDGSGEPS